MDVLTEASSSPFLDERQLKTFELRPNARNTLMRASRAGKIATAEITNIFPSSLIRDREKFPKAVEWVAKLLKAIQVKIYVGQPEELEEIRAKARPSLDESETDSLSATPKERFHRQLPEKELEKIKTIEDNFSGFYESEEVPFFYREVKRYPLLGHEQILELGKRVLDSQDLEARNLLVLHNLRLAVHIARKYIGRGLDYDDLVQEGCIGLMTAADKYDYRQGFHFSTYAYWWVRQKITRAIVEQPGVIRLPQHAYDFRRKVLKEAQSLAFDLGREPTVEEIAAETGEEVAKIKNALESLHLQVLSLDEILSSDSETGNQWHDVFPDETAMDPITKINARDELASSCEKVSNVLGHLLAIPTLSERDKEVFEKFYGLDGTWEHGRTLEQIGEEFGVSRERIRQLVSNAWETLHIANPSLEMNHDTLMLEFERIARLEKVVSEQATLEVRELSSEEKRTIAERIALAQSGPSANQSKSYVRANSVAISNFDERIPRLLSAVSSAYGITLEELLGQSREPKFAWPRQVTMYLLRIDLNLTFPAIAEELKRDHTTVIYGCQIVKEALDKDDGVKEDIRRIRAACNNAPNAVKRPETNKDGSNEISALASQLAEGWQCKLTAI